MIALAQVFQSMGIEVLGSDEGDGFSDDLIRRLKIKVFEKFDKKNIPCADVVVASAAYSEKNVEVKEAIRRKIPLLTYAQALGLVFNEKYGIAVAGTHGKSTTTAILGEVLEEAGFDPTVVVGARVSKWQSNARIGKSEYLVAEADEYKDNFLNYWPKALIITNIEYDHPDYFKDFKQYRKSFEEMAKRIPEDGIIVTNEKLPKTKCRVIGFSEADCKIPGRHNRLNAGAVAALALELGVKKNIIQKSLENFSGIGRRFEIKKTKRVVFIDDYAHHPKEIQAVLQGARERYSKKKIWAVFQPHTFSRTKALLNDFARSFKQADEVIILDIYGSAREKEGKIHAKDLVDLIKGSRYLPTIEEAAKHLEKNCREGDIVLAIGAGDIWKLSTIANLW